MILVIDNYDSFTYNLVQLLLRLGAEVSVVRNDIESCEELLARGADGIVISPGPGRPENAGVCVDLLRLRAALPILGVCLGHQALGYAFGAEITGAATLMHGKTSLIEHDGDGLFSGIEQGFEATRYHSLVVAEASLPQCLRITARTSDGTIMGMEHRELPYAGVQFHPESVLTSAGGALLRNFLDRVAEGAMASVGGTERGVSDSAAGLGGKGVRHG